MVSLSLSICSLIKAIAKTFFICLEYCPASGTVTAPPVVTYSLSLTSRNSSQPTLPWLGILHLFLGQSLGLAAAGFQVISLAWPDSEPKEIKLAKSSWSLHCNVSPAGASRKTVEQEPTAWHPCLLGADSGGPGLSPPACWAPGRKRVQDSSGHSPQSQKRALQRNHTCLKNNTLIIFLLVWHSSTSPSSRHHQKPWGSCLGKTWKRTPQPSPCHFSPTLNFET